MSNETRPGTPPLIQGLPGTGPGRGLGAGESVTVLYRAQAPGLTRLAMARLHDRAAAEDVVQEAFCGLYRRWTYLAETASAPAYLRASVLNGCRSVQRGRARGQAPLEEQAPRDRSAPLTPSAESAVLAREERRAVWAGLRTLPPRQREAVTLRYLGGLSVPDVARIMSVADGTVKSAISRGLGSLGGYLQAQGR